MFVAFEGIDGSGKTTISNRVAERLRQQGHVVEHARAGGRFQSRVTQNIRELARDARNMALRPRAEFLLYVARDAQLLEEVVRPALARADLVIGDRSLTSAEVLAHHGRGLPIEELRPTLLAAAGSLEPDLVVLVDIDPHIARARRRTAKLLNPDGLPSSRKGLTGGGLIHRLRAGYREIAAGRPDRWVVVSNSDRPLEQVVTDVADVLSIALTSGVPAAIEEAHRRSLDRPSAPEASLGTPEEAASAYVEWLGRRAALEPDVAAYFLGGLAGPEVDDLRLALAEVAPRMMAHGLAGLGDEVSWSLRRKLRDAAPTEVAHSLRGHTVGLTEEAWMMRHALAACVPAAVAASLDGLDGEAAFVMRQVLMDQAPDAVATSLEQLDSEDAWALRERCLASMGSSLSAPEGYEASRVAALSVLGIEGERAWAVRKEARKEAPVAALHSIKRLQDERAWRWRMRFVDMAPRPVMSSVTGLDHPAAWELRERTIASCRETLDSMSGLDHATAWRLRELALDIWPSAVVKSLGALSATPRGRGIVARQLRRYPQNIALLRHVARIAIEQHAAQVLAA